MSETQAEIERHNTREMWRDVANHLRCARECIDTAQGVLDDLNVAHIAANLVPVADAVARFRDLAESKVAE